ncbi:hypothetical protein BN903_263 [Halorubrum sp. AJ67]|nr:hypothetical protein BN903_263 [Halorubrum sp. AJ67]
MNPIPVVPARPTIKVPTLAVGASDQGVNVSDSASSETS